MRSAFALLVPLLIARILIAADVSGNWEFAADYLKDTNYARVRLEAEDGKITGNLNELAIEGTCRSLFRARSCSSVTGMQPRAMGN